MLEVGWTEILVIAIVLIIVVGPKDLPQMLRTFGRMVSKLRGMAGEFRQQFDEALREADLDDVRKTIGDAQKLNPMNAIRDAVNPLRQMGDEIKSDLQKTTSVSAASSTAADATTGESGTAGADSAAPAPAAAATPIAAAVAALPLAAAPVSPVQAAPIEPVRSAGDAGQQGGTAPTGQTKPVVKASAAKAPTAKTPAAKTAASKPAVRKTAAAKAPKAAPAKAESAMAESAKPAAAKAKAASKAAGKPAARTTTRKPKKDMA